MAIWKFKRGDGISNNSPSRFEIINGGTMESTRFATGGTGDIEAASERIVTSSAFTVTATSSRTQFHVFQTHAGDDVANKGTLIRDLVIAYTPLNGVEAELSTDDYSFIAQQATWSFTFGDAVPNNEGDTYTLSYVQVRPEDIHFVCGNRTNATVILTLPAPTGGAFLELLYYDAKRHQQTYRQLNEDFEITLAAGEIADFAFLNYTSVSIPLGIGEDAFRTAHGAAGANSRNNSPNTADSRIYWGRIN